MSIDDPIVGVLIAKAIAFLSAGAYFLKKWANKRRDKKKITIGDAVKIINETKKNYKECLKEGLCDGHIKGDRQKTRKDKDK